MVENFFYLITNLYSNLFLFWWPWISISSDVFLLQFIILYLLFLILSSKNIYYILLYLFLEIFAFGVYLAILQLELFTGFLWVLEATVVFIFLIVLFYTNFKGYINDFDTKIFFFNKYAYAVVFFFVKFNVFLWFWKLYLRRVKYFFILGGFLRSLI